MIGTHGLVRGFTLIDVLVTCALLGLMFAGIFGGVQVASELIGLTKAKTGALSIANERIEYIRSQLYADVGTVAGIPPGAIPQNAATSLNGVTYNVRTLIQYVDSPDDGTGASDSNGILADYKEAKVEVTWNVGFGTSTVFLLTNIVPSGIETTDGGGTLTVNVFDADIQPLPGASVRIYNNTTTSTIDVTRSTNASGIAMFGGAPAAANYEITVTDTGYSTDQTYSATTSNPNPATPHVAVIEGAVSTMNFQIDELSDLTVRTVAPATYDYFTDSFADSSQLFSLSDTDVTGGALTLLGAPGSYPMSGTAQTIPITSGSLLAWNQATWVATTTGVTAVRMRVYEVTGTSTYTIIPDADLSGNSTGFTVSPIDLSTLSVGTYGTLALVAELTSSDSDETPAISIWEVMYTEDEPNIPNVDFELRGAKTIGTNASLAPIYKYQATHDSGAGASVTISDLEWDVYSVTLVTPGYDISNACPSLPYALDPGVSETLTLTLVSASAHTLRVQVVNSAGDPIPNATVELSQGASSIDTESSSLCGQVFFDSGLGAATDYELFVQALGYSDTTVTGVSVDGDSLVTVTMAP